MNPVSITIIVIVSFILIIYMISALFSYKLYKNVWMIRTHEINNPVKIRFEDIEDHTRKIPISFPLPKKKNGETQLIEAFLYSPKDKNTIKKPVIILSPGYGKTHLSYLIDIGMLTSFGYEVLAYDQYGSGLSSGNIQGGIHYGTKTLSVIIDKIKETNLFEGRPLYLYGHSWGGYSVLSVLKKFPTIKKVISRSPAGKPILSSYVAGAYLVGKPLAYYLYFCAWLPLFIRFGPKAFLSSQGILRKNTSTEVLITSCQDDPVLSKVASPIPYFEKHPQKNVTIYVRDDAHIHNDILTQKGWDYYLEKEKEFTKISKNLGPEYIKQIKEFESTLDRSKISIDQKEANLIKEFLEK